MPAVLADALRFAAAPRGLLEHLMTPADLDETHAAALRAFAEGKREGADLKRQADEIATWQREQLSARTQRRAG